MGSAADLEIRKEGRVHVIRLSVPDGEIVGKVSTEGYSDTSFLADPERDIAFTDGK